MSWVFNEQVLAVVTVIIVAASIFAVAQQAMNIRRVVEPFSELALLGPNRMIGGYPREVVAGSPFLLHVYVGNQEGRTMLYKILVKAGNRTSHINGTTPLSAQPLLEIYTVLPHNSSSIIPLNVTLHHPANNLRLVFEMWIFNETSGEFAYHGRWNQLWLNVTEPASGSWEPESPSLLPPSMEASLADAFYSIRRAEDSGGDVTGMVLMLNLAIGRAQNKNFEGAESLVKQVLLLEPKVIQAGLEYRRAQLLYTVAASASTATVSIGLFLYLRHRIWLIFLKAYGGWRVTPLNIESLGSTTLENKARDLLSSESVVRVNDIIALGDELGRERWSIAREVFNWAGSKAVRLEDPEPPSTFIAFILSVHNLSFPTIILLIALTVLTIYAAPTVVTTYLRYILGSLFVLFLPGYSLMEALYYKEGDLTPLERLALSIGLSLALVPLVGLILNYTPWGIRLDPIVASLSTLTLFLATLASYRKYSLLKLSAVSVASS